MITIQIDKTLDTKEDLTDYLSSVIKEIENGQMSGKDWELSGKEELICQTCKDRGFVESIEWTDTDTSYEEIKHCPDCSDIYANDCLK